MPKSALLVRCASSPADTATPAAAAAADAAAADAVRVRSIVILTSLKTSPPAWQTQHLKSCFESSNVREGLRSAWKGQRHLPLLSGEWEEDVKEYWGKL